MKDNKNIRLFVRYIIYDVIVIIISSYLSLIARFDFKVNSVDEFYLKNLTHYLPINIILTLLIFMAFGLYYYLWEHAGLVEMGKIAIAVFFADIVQFIAMWLLGFYVPRSYYFIYFVLLVIGSTTIRYFKKGVREVYSYPWKRNRQASRSVLLYGAGEAGRIILKEVYGSEKISDISVVAILDDDTSKWGTFIFDIPVIGGRDKLKECVDKYQISEIMIAIPSLYGSARKELVESCAELNCKVSIMPGMFQLINKDINISSMREVDLDDLLGRSVVETNLDSVMEYVSGRCVLVTGGGGSIGSELCRQIANYLPRKLIILDNYENNAYELQTELLSRYPYLDLEVIIGSVQDRCRMHDVFSTYKPELIYHAAAHKHVPLMEISPCEAIKNNVCGTINVAMEAEICHAKKFVMISTDKAVRPTNIMGASKRICEMVIQAANRTSNTEYVAVRFGNVLGSNGSVVPLFKRQISQGGPVTVTHPEVTRYFMTIPEAVSLVLQAGSYAKGGEIFILDMGEPVKIVDMARKLIRLSGFVPDEDIAIKFTGLRPGEKLYEELLMDEEKTSTTNERIFVGKPINIDEAFLKQMLSDLKAAAYSDDSEHIRDIVRELVPEYTPQDNAN